MTGQTRTKATHRRVRQQTPVPPAPPPASRHLGGRSGRPALLALCLAGGAVSLTACSHGPSDATTTLRGATGVTVVAADGSVHPAVDGEHLSIGETVHTTTADAALVTGGRVTTLGPSTAMALAGRSHYLLDAGTVVVDHRHGRDARVDAGPVTVDDIGATSVRIERGFAVRVAVFDGGSANVAASQRSTAVPALHEIDVPGSSLPADPSPLALRDDALDAVASPGLVAADEALAHRASTLDAAGGSAVPASLMRALPAEPAATAPSERILPVAIARADSAASLATAYARVEGLRADGGSWGVVTALVGVQVGAVQQQLDALLTETTAALALPVGTGENGGAAAVTAVLAAAAPHPVTPAPSVTGGGGPTSSPSAPVRGAPPAPVPTVPVPTVPPLVQSLVNTIVGLLPSGGTSAPPPAPKATPTPVATPTATGGLLGGVLGSLLGAG